MSDAPTNIRRPRGRTGGSAVRVISAVLSIVILALTVPFFARVDAAAAAPAVGVPEAFWVQDWSTGAYLRVQATACYVGEHVVVYVHDKVSMSEYLVNHLGTTFDETTYPTLTHALGPEPNPGIDGDPRIAILIYDFNDKTNSVDGSFNAYDIDPRDSRTSNRREMFYLNLQAIEAEPHNIGALAAHEFAHLIVYYRDGMLDPSPGRACEDLWLLEGFTTYAEHLAGYDARVSGQWQSFMNDPNFNLTFWQGVRANYGASYSFMRYLAAREGPEFVRALVDQPLDGVAGIDAALDCVGSASDFAGLR